MATPLLLVLLIIELSDVIFAVDSIPAVFGVTLDPFIVYTSNMFAILSLRGLYGFVSNVLTKLVYLEKRYVQLLAPRTAHSHSFLALACSAASLWFWDSSVERF